MRHLQRVPGARAGRSGEPPGREPAQPHADRAVRRRDRTARPGGGTRRSRRSENDPTQTRSCAPVRSTSSASAGDGGLGLEVDVEPRPREVLEQLGHRGDRLPAADQRARPGRRTPRSAIVPVRAGDPVQGGVVEGEQHPVAGRVHVGLEVAVAEAAPRAGRRRGCSRARRARGAARRRGGRRPAPRRAGQVPRRGRGNRCAVASRLQYPRHAPTLAANRGRAHPRCYSARVRAGESAWRQDAAARAEYRRTMEEMTCPQCQSTMAPRYLGDVTVHQCSSCQRGLPRARRPRQPDRGGERLARDSGPKTQPLPRITADMTAPPPSRPVTRSYIETLFG